MSFDEFAELWHLSRRRTRSEMDYRLFQKYQAKLVLKYLRRYGLDIVGQRVLDMGSGIGGYSLEMAQQGARVFSLDLIQPRHQQDGHNAMVIGNALKVPVCDNAFDLVFCTSLIEHIAAPETLLTEIKRVLIRGGYCYLSFPPFYSPMGGHEFSPFHYLGDRFALRLKGSSKRVIPWVDDLYKISKDPQGFSDLYENWGLYRMTVAKARRLIQAGGWCLVDMSTRYLPVSLIRWPVVGEFFTWHAQFLLRKPFAP